MRTYEMVLVLQPGLGDEGVNELLDKLSELVGTEGGEVTFRGQLGDRKGNLDAVEEEGWKVRRLAYPINNNKEGYYAVLHVDAESDVVEVVQPSLRYNDDVLRYLTIRVED